MGWEERKKKFANASIDLLFGYSAANPGVLHQHDGQNAAAHLSHQQQSMLGTYDAVVFSVIQTCSVTQSNKLLQYTYLRSFRQDKKIKLH